MQQTRWALESLERLNALGMFAEYVLQTLQTLMNTTKQLYLANEANKIIAYFQEEDQPTLKATYEGVRVLELLNKAQIFPSHGSLTDVYMTLAGDMLAYELAEEQRASAKVEAGRDEQTQFIAAEESQQAQAIETLLSASQVNQREITNSQGATMVPASDELPEKGTILQALYNGYFEDYKKTFPQQLPMSGDEGDDASEPEPSQMNAQFLGSGALDDLLAKIDSIGAAALSRGKAALHTMGTVDVDVLIRNVENAMMTLREQAKVFGDGRQAVAVIDEIERFADDFRILMNKAAERLEKIKNEPNIEIIQDGKVIKKQIPVPALLRALDAIVESVPATQRFRHAQYTEYLIKSMEDWTGLPKLSIGYRKIMEYAARGTAKGEESRNLNTLADNLVGMSENGENLHFIGMSTLKETDELVPATGALVAPKKFTDDMDEIVRQVMGIDTILEKTRLYDQKKLTQEEIFNNMKILDASGLTPTGRRGTFQRANQETLLFEIFTWYKREGLKGQLSGIEIVGDATGNIEYRFVEFIKKQEIDDIKASKIVALNQVEKKAAELVTAISELGVVGKGNKSTTHWKIDDIMGCVTSKTPEVLTNWGRTHNRYNAFRRAFEDLIGDLSGTHPYYESVESWAKYTGTSNLRSWEKGYESNVYEEIISACRAKTQNPSPSNRGWYSRLEETPNLLGNLQKGAVVVKSAFIEIKKGVNNIGNDILYTKFDDGDTVESGLKTIMKNVEETAPQITDINRLASMANWMKQLYRRLVGRPMQDEEYYQFLIEAAFRKGDGLAEDGTGKILKEIIKDANGPRKDWDEVLKLRISNLRDKASQNWLLDHIYVYRNKWTGEVVVVPVQDKLMVVGKTDEFPWKIGGSVDGSIKDLHSLQNVAQGFLNEIKRKIAKDTIVDWGSLEEGFFSCIEKTDKEILEDLISLIRDPSIATSVIPCMRIGGIDKSQDISRITTAFLCWEPEQASLYRVAQRFLNQADSLPHQDFGHELARALNAMDQSILLDLGGGSPSEFARFESRLFWGINEKSLSTEEADEIVRILDRRMGELLAQIPPQSVPYSRQMLTDLGYSKLGELYGQLQILRQKAATLRIQYGSPISISAPK